MEPIAKSYLYWTGCAANYDARVAAIVRATTKVLRAAGITVNFLGEEEVCTGDAARRLGEEGLFQQLALQNIATLQRHGVERVVTHCAHCFHVLKNEYPRFGARFEVYHHSELIAQLLSEERIRLRSDTRLAATLHDSCYIGRYNQIFDAPRKIMRAVYGADTVEMPRHREKSFCCGAGGANYWYDAPKKESAGVIRIREAIRAGARTVVAECPFCVKMLEQGAQSATAGNEITIRDISEIIAEVLFEDDNVSAQRAGGNPRHDDRMNERI
jgi:Fe-S oxidoreductase